jgi:hypothetical protein
MTIPGKQFNWALIVVCTIYLSQMIGRDDGFFRNIGLWREVDVSLEKAGLSNQKTPGMGKRYLQQM